LAKDFIIIPTYNEKQNIERLIPVIFKLYPDIHIMVVDDNSPDETSEIVKGMAGQYKNLFLNLRPRKLGLASAYLETIQKLLNENNDIRSIITMDADFSHDPVVIERMLKEISNYDLVIGSRYIPGGGIKNWGIRRRILSRGGNLYARSVIGLPTRDLTTGYQCFRKELLEKYDFNSIHSTGYAFLMEMKAIAYTLKARTKEVPITYMERTVGKSKISNRIIYEGIIAPWRIRFSQYIKED